jgi:hypothetical protein
MNGPGGDASECLCPNVYVNPRIQATKTVLKKGGSITLYRKLNTITKTG